MLQLLPSNDDDDDDDDDKEEEEEGDGDDHYFSDGNDSDGTDDNNNVQEYGHGWKQRRHIWQQQTHSAESAQADILAYDTPTTTSLSFGSDTMRNFNLYEASSFTTSGCGFIAGCRFFHQFHLFWRNPK